MDGTKNKKPQKEKLTPPPKEEESEYIMPEPDLDSVPPTDVTGQTADITKKPKKSSK